jgi:hypothetical protein
MIKTKLVTVQREEVISIECDKCHGVFEDTIDLQEFHHIRFTGGYGSVFGDETRVECDLCQRCLKELVGGFCRTT